MMKISTDLMVTTKNEKVEPGQFIIFNKVYLQAKKLS